MATVNLAMSGGVNDVSRRDGKWEWKIYDAVFDATKHALAQNDVAQMIDIPAESFVAFVQWKVETVEGAARNFSLGDGVSATGFLASTSANAVASGLSAPVSLTEGAPNTVTGFSGGKYYSADDTLDLTAVTAGGLTATKIRVRAVMCHFK